GRDDRLVTARSEHSHDRRDRTPIYRCVRTGPLEQQDVIVTMSTMQVGLMSPQGWKGEYDGWDPAAAWGRSVELAVQAEALGFESLWVFDHFHTVPQPTDEITFESFTMLGALAQVTHRVRLGHMVVCTGFRNPAVTAKMASTLDVLSGGRFELGIGAGWKEDEWRGYGFGFPTLRERMAIFGDHLEVIKRMLEPGRATYEGRYAHVRGAINEPKGLQAPRIPIIVGGNGRNVTFRYAARFADELNLVFIGVDEIAELLPVIRQRCEEEDRDPATLKVSLYCRDHDVREPGSARVAFLADLADLGLSRLVAFIGRWSVDLDAQPRFAEDVRAAGLTLSPRAGTPTTVA
ncbi:MAG TPA: TIGR03560 family F420-dependent LLM class oxidoreductase, partial [Candidatus Limnocylindrales bacterium]